MPQKLNICVFDLGIASEYIIKSYKSVNDMQV